MSYDPRHNIVAATGRTATADELYRKAIFMVLILIPIDAILGHVALNRVLADSVVTSWVLAIFVSTALAGLAHIAGYVLSLRDWVLGSVLASAWLATVAGIGYVRWSASEPAASSSGGLSMDMMEPAAQTTDHTQLAATILMVALFILTGALSAFVGAHRSPHVDARKKALASVRSTETELKQAEADLARDEHLHRGHVHQVSQIDIEAARAIQAQRQLTQLLTVRAAIALREKTGDASNDFHLQAPAQPRPNAEAERLLTLLESGVDKEN